MENFKGSLHLEALDNLVNIAEKILQELQAHIDEDVVEKSIEFSEKSVGEFRESKQELGVARLELFSLADRTGKILVGGDLKSSLRRISAEYSLIKLEGVSQSYRLAINTFRQTERQIRDLERFLYDLSKLDARDSRDLTQAVLQDFTNKEEEFRDNLAVLDVLEDLEEDVNTFLIEDLEIIKMWEENFRLFEKTMEETEESSRSSSEIRSALMDLVRTSEEFLNPPTGREGRSG